jgi:hypothetical protein
MDQIVKDRSAALYNDNNNSYASLKPHPSGAATFSITTYSIMALSIKTLSLILLMLRVI